MSVRRICLLTLLLLWPGAAAHAESDVEADGLIARGVELRKQGKNAEALAEFQRAYQRQPSPRAAAQVALAQQALGDWAAAERGLLAALAATDDAWITRQRAPLTAALETVRGQLASLSVETDVAAAQLFVDGIPLGAAPFAQPLRLPAGPHQIAARAPGYQSKEQRVDLAARSEQHLSLSLAPQPLERAAAPAAPVTSPTTSALAAPPSPYAGSAPSTPKRPSPSAQARSWSSAADSGSGLRTAAVVSFVASGLALATGVTAHAIREYHAYEWNHCKAPVEARCGGYRTTVKDAETVAIIGYASAAGLLAGGLALWLAAPSDDAEPRLQAWSLGVDPHGVSAVWRSAW